MSRSQRTRRGVSVAQAYDSFLFLALALVRVTLPVLPCQDTRGRRKPVNAPISPVAYRLWNLAQCPLFCFGIRLLDVMLFACCNSWSLAPVSLTSAVFIRFPNDPALPSPWVTREDSLASSESLRFLERFRTLRTTCGDAHCPDSRDREVLRFIGSGLESYGIRAPDGAGSQLSSLPVYPRLPGGIAPPDIRKEFSQNSCYVNIHKCL